ncbi:polysaccharide deacetylase family protein [Clostridium sediminicola]|uniref:polysaccharide deacetylase family protein n=1 Tax=Clostridium sediminicola TaxID=3114879 RepID=UPI0031F1C6F0
MIYLTVIVAIFIMYSIIPTYYFKFLDKNVIKSFNDTNNIALTFDDGPDKVYTEKLLDTLKEFNVKATFFIVAKSAAENHHIIERMITEGHSLGLHSLEHKNALFKGYFYMKKDFEESIAIMKKYGWNIVYYRPPWGHFNLFSVYFIKKYNLKLVLWNVMVGDWAKSVSASEIENRLIKKTNKGSIICLHDGRGANNAPKRTISALENVIPKLKKDGFHFTLLEDSDE